MPSPRVLDNLEQLRVALKELINEIADGSLSVAQVLSMGDDDRTYVYVVKALEAVPGIGKVRARRILEELSIGEQARVCELSAMQRDRVIERASSHS